MEDKKDRILIFTFVGVLAVALITLGLTYAYWILTKQQNGENVVNSACLNINFTGENDINLEKAYPMNTEQLERFLSKATPYHFIIENTCDDLANATINLESLDAGVEKQLNDEYIDAILYENDYHNNLNSEKQLNASMYNDENKVISSSLHAYELYNFVLQKGETKSFNLLLYMDPNTPMETANMNATWKGKITLSTNYKEEPTANLNGLKVPVVESGDGLYAVSHDVSEISTDWNKTEYRYVGANINNYVSFNNEIWRVIGLVNVKNGENIEQRIKIVRTNGIMGQKDFGEYSWDYKQSGQGSSISNNGSNNWVDSQLKDMLNGIYYEGGIGVCYKDITSTQCDFNSGTDLPKGLNLKAQNMIDKEIIWNIGGSNNLRITTKEYYEKERGANTFNNYPTEWSNETDVGEKYNGIGLIYPSDYGYAIGGEIRNKCLTDTLYLWHQSCNTNDWLKPSSGNLLTISPNSSNPVTVFNVDSTGFVAEYTVNNTNVVWPTLYLKSSVKITPNPQSEQEYGTIDNPFQLSNE